MIHIPNMIINNIIDRAKKSKKKIVLPESMDVRVLKAASQASIDGIADIILIGKKEDMLNDIMENTINISNITFIDPKDSPNRQKYIEALYGARSSKGMTMVEAEKLIDNYTYFATMMVREGDADGMVSGACHATSDTLRPALQVIKGREPGSTISSFFLMEVPNSKYKSAYIFSDCGLIENPTENQLVDIAIAANDSYKNLIGGTPKVAMLSYSTKGSAKSESIDKTNRAIDLIKQKRPDIIIDGEMQVDSAIDKTVGLAKAPGSPVAGDANVLVFPDLNSGNIAYKLVQRFGDAKAYGPITQGLLRPVNDLSRGCNVEDIIGVIAITAVQA